MIFNDYEVVMSFNQEVYNLLRLIPKGKVVTYSQIALCLGNAKLARAVGNALHNNPNPKLYPCHRVVNRKGELSKAFAFGGSGAQMKMLVDENTQFDRFNRVRLDICGFDIEKFIKSQS
ncbi:MAG: MGMT family protein [Campylobacter lanienae]|uniref:MGMT family protein n=1 Tax=Campylobacter lanienae TaxID=75658 RepID=UPI00242E0684|nr:MGMT family protein [Campylobacter lanienae]MCI5539142.1 MGMT family protein [Campylobacter lanienae]MDY6134640.1 MGMT family protein [Campylobacter lanienae]